MSKEFKMVNGMKISVYFVMLNLIFSIIAFSFSIGLVSAQGPEPEPELNPGAQATKDLVTSFGNFLGDKIVGLTKPQPKPGDSSSKPTGDSGPTEETPKGTSEGTPEETQGASGTPEETPKGIGGGLFKFDESPIYYKNQATCDAAAKKYKEEKNLPVQPVCKKVALNSKTLSEYPKGDDNIKLRESIENNWASLTNEDKKYYLYKGIGELGLEKFQVTGDIGAFRIEEGKLFYGNKQVFEGSGIPAELKELIDKQKYTKNVLFNFDTNSAQIEISGRQPVGKSVLSALAGNYEDFKKTVKIEGVSDTDIKIATAKYGSIGLTGGDGTSSFGGGAGTGEPVGYQGSNGGGGGGGIFGGGEGLFGNPLMTLLLIGGGIALMMMMTNDEGETEVEPTAQGFSANVKNGGAVALLDTDGDTKIMAGSKKDGSQGKIETIGKNAAVAQNVDINVPDQVAAKLSDEPVAILLNGEDGDSPNTYSETDRGSSPITAAAILEIPNGNYFFLDEHDASISLKDSSVYSKKSWNVVSIEGKNVRFYPNTENRFMFIFNGKKTYASTTLRDIKGVVSLENKDEETIFALQEFTNKKGLIYDSERAFSYTDVTREHNGILISVLRAEMLS